MTCASTPINNKQQCTTVRAQHSTCCHLLLKYLLKIQYNIFTILLSIKLLKYYTTLTVGYSLRVSPVLEKVERYIAHTENRHPAC